MAAVLLSGCGEKAPPPEPAPPEPSAAAYPSTKPLTHTTQRIQGRVDFSLLRPRMDHVPDVLLIDAEQPETTRILETQLQRYQTYREARMDDGSSIEGLTREERLLRTQINEAMSPQNRETLESAFAELKRGFPPAQAVSTPSGSLSPRAEMGRPLWELFQAINPYNFARAVPVVQERLRSTNQQLLAAHEAAAADSPERDQIQVDLQWLEQVVRFANEKLPPLAEQYERWIHQMYADLASNPDQAWVASLMDPIDRWEQTRAREFPEIRRYLASRLIDRAATDQDGTFSVQGQGSLVIRLALDGQELFIPAQTLALPVQIEDLRQRTVEIVPAQDALPDS